MRFLQFEEFAGCLNDTFHVDIEQVRAPFVLVEARPMATRVVAGAVRDAFSLLFRHEAAILLPQRTYPMSHARLGDFGIFLVPIARDRDGFLYQAVFN